MTLDQEAIAAFERHAAVRRVRFVGSRATGNATKYSDWDFAVETDDFPAVARDIESLSRDLRPLAQQWDRLSDTQCWMLMLPGPTKLDFIFTEPHDQEPPWQPNADNLAAIDQHFWDWALWLHSKRVAGKRELVVTELRKMFEHILQPMRVGEPPSSLDAAVTDYLAAHDRLERGFGIDVPRTLEREVVPALSAPAAGARG